MSQKERRSKTEQAEISKQLDRLFFYAAEEKMLPKIIYDYSLANKSTHLSKEYRKSVKNIYTKQTQLPLQYNPEEARSHREKFREKVLKLVNNELPIQYLKSGNISGKNVMMYRGRPLEEVQYPVKQGYQIFTNFNETKFKKGLTKMFEDKLEYTHQKLFNNTDASPVKRNSKNCVTEPATEIKRKSQPPTLEQTPSRAEEFRIKPISLPKLIARTQLEKINKNMTPPLTSVRVKKPKKIPQCDENSLIIEKMKQIGGYSQNIPTERILITKESIVKYFRQFYPRPHRIIDFLEFSDVETVDSYSQIPRKIKLMPNEHIYFMSFLFYDTNNDGYICDNDLFRVSEILKKCPLLTGDYDLMKKKGKKVEYNDSLPYKELYKLPEISEAVFFTWSKKQDGFEEKKMDEKQQEIKNYFGYLNRKKILIDYEGFKKLLKDEKPFLWYDLMWRISGITFPQLKYK